MKDWLGNNLEVGDKVLYTSKSSNTGMVLGILTEASSQRIQIRIIGDSANRSHNKVITLHRNNQAFKSVTKYQGVADLG